MKTDNVVWEASNLHPRFGAKLTGGALGASAEPDTVRGLLDAVHRYGVILIRDQILSDDDILQLAKSLGRPRDKSPVTGKDMGVFRLTNLNEKDEILAADDAFLRLNDANELWHTDSTYFRPRTSLSFLYSRLIPPEGGNTEFCDTRCAYEDLDADLQAELAGKTASHSLIQSRALVGYDDWAPEVRERLVAIDRPLIHLHKELGRTALCLASHISKIAPMNSEGASDALLSFLMDAATRAECVYSHQWAAGDLLIWDNRCTMHRARPYDQSAHKRDLRGIRLDDEDDLIAA